MKTNFILGLFILICLSATAQQDPLQTQFFTNPLSVNPAYAGSRAGTSLLAMFRAQWTGYDGAPLTQTLAVHSPIFEGRSGIGLNLVYDKLGIESSFTLNLAYAYRIEFEKGILSLGLQGQLRRQQMDWERLGPNDPAIPYQINSALLPNAGAGIYFESERFFAGFSVPHILENRLKFSEGAQSQEILARYRRHYYLMGGLVINAGESLKLRPSVLIKGVANAPMQLDVNLALIIKNKLWIGATTRSAESIGLFMQYHPNKKFRIGYAYDFVTNRLPSTAGSHEIFIGFDIPGPNRGFDHPRYF